MRIRRAVIDAIVEHARAEASARVLRAADRDRRRGSIESCPREKHPGESRSHSWSTPRTHFAAIRKARASGLRGGRRLPLASAIAGGTVTRPTSGKRTIPTCARDRVARRARKARGARPIESGRRAFSKLTLEVEP